MGNSLSGHSDNNVFEKELAKLNVVVNSIISDKDIFNNKDYNFLSQDVCENYQVVLEEELSKHLTLEVKELGAKLFIIPKVDDDTESRLTKYKLTKRQVCEKISNHYIKILYILCLIKYVYNIEKSGDLSIAGIVLRNIKIVDDMMQIYFCGLPHKDFSSGSNDHHRIDFSKLEGMKFFTEFFLDPQESHTFLGILRSVLARNSPQKVQQKMCHYLHVHGAKDIKHLEKLYASRFDDRLHCKQEGGNHIDLHMYIEKDNPVFNSDYCSAPVKLVIKLRTPQGKKVHGSYKQLKNNYNKNVESIMKIISKLVNKDSSGKYSLRDIDKRELNVIIDEVKIVVKSFYIQSIFDFQNMLDLAKKTPNIHIT